MAFCSKLGVYTTPFWRQNAVIAHPLWLRLRRFRHYSLKKPIDETKCAGLA